MASTYIYDKKTTVFPEGILNEQPVKSKSDNCSITGLELYKEHFIIVADSAEDVIKIYDLRMLKQFI